MGKTAGWPTARLGLARTDDLVVAAHDYATRGTSTVTPDEPDLLRAGVRVPAQALMEAEVTAQVGAEPRECTGKRTPYRNGYRTRTWDTRVGTLEADRSVLEGPSSGKFTEGSTAYR